MFENLGNLGGLVKQAMQMKQRMTEVQAELEKQIHQASSGGGMVTARVNGRGELQEIKINPEVVKSEDVEMLEELVKAAVCAAFQESQEAAKKALGEVTGGLSIPGLDGLLGGGQ
ncbi:MAG: YbaB/EbfC family nucleoid-associated protein [Phycisphaerae bacterium]|nr:YbaB/EbfC family nucleoid-associated protein [Phycisphaerae bacterium]